MTQLEFTTSDNHYCHYLALSTPVTPARVLKSRRLISYSIWCILFAVSTTLGIVLNNTADCLSSSNINSSSGGDRVFVVKQAAVNPSSYKQTKQSFKEVFEKLAIHVKENTPIGTKLADIQPREDDSHGGGHQQQNDKIIYAIVGGTDQQSFTLRVENTLNKVELVSEVNFDYESTKRNYHVIIRATSLYLRYEVDVDILVTDENDNKPQLDDFAIVFNNYRNNFPTGPIGRVPATDLDIDDVLHYRVLSGNNAQLIFVNETNGDIQLSPWLNSNVPLKAVMDIAVSDGLNEAVAKLVLTVNLVTETMLHNSVVVRLDGIDRDEFLSKKYDLFLSQMARVLGTNSMYGTNNIVVFDVEESLHSETLSSHSDPSSPLHYRPYHGSSIINSSLSVNVSFSARADGNDVETYLSSQYIEERIHMSRAQLSQNLEVQVAPFQDNLCVHEPCQNYQECQATYKFDKAPKTFYTNANMIFRPIKAIQSFACTCPPTFTGMKHKNECNLQINQCFSNPCLNGGICHRHESGYTCECKPEFIGTRCEHSFVNSTCQSIAKTPSQSQSLPMISSNLIVTDDSYNKQQATICSGKSRCVNLNKSHYSLGKPTSSISGGSGFTCQGCPYSQWSTELCQLRARSFDKNSYITLPSLRRRHRFHLMLQFATVQSDALLIYNGRYNDKHDFIALEIVDSRLKFSYSLGNSITSVSLSTMPVSNGEWHKVAIEYRDRNVTLIVDDCDPVIDETLAKIQGSAATKRCSNTSYAIESSNLQDYKMLDLTSPMQIGALPTGLPHEFQLSSQNSFSGCISDIYIDHQLVDLSSPIQDFGTQPGCPEKRTFCQQHSCNGFQCQDSYGAAKCNCGDERLGKSCEVYISNEKVRKFSGNSYLTFNPIEANVPPHWQVSLHFRTINPNGVLFKVSLDPEASIVFELSNGGLKLTHRLRSMTFNKIALDDGEWHFVELIWSNDSAMLRVDYNPNLSVQSTEIGNIVGLVMRSVIVGASSSRSTSGATENNPQSLPPPETSPEFSSLSGSTQAPEDFSSVYMYGANSSQSFVGCIYGLNISDNVEWWMSPNDERNVERGCPVIDVCESQPCPANSRCIKRGMNQRKCICNQGFVGDQCLPVCDLNPCQGESSKCLPVKPFSIDQISDQTITTSGSSNNNNDNSSPNPITSVSSQYTCQCESHRSGKNCENQLSPGCPSNWWGRPVSGSGNSSICGPCNCDESKGFDGDCDKLTGQCYCKSSHYQPIGSDYCLACDCYLVGSISSTCNQTSGQCKCRPGVVGRRCDTCASPYAEVTLRGCEVIYDACPKTFSDGIWWDKTQLDRLATQQCPPSTSTGTATRFCHKTEGWQKANLFDCISNTFTDLYTQYQFLEENKFQMTTNLAMKIASNLRNALNETISSPSMQLYGSDMYISFRLLHHLIQHESHQQGLNLTHRQDRLYIRNIAESISHILDPMFAENWPEIAARSPNGGAEHLLRLVDTYGKILIDSQSDTFTQPFEVSTKHFTFGMDTLSTDQLWDLSRWSLSTGNNPSNTIGHFPSSPPYATDPFESPPGSLDGRPLSTSRHNNEQAGHFNSDGTSVYLDYTANRDSSPSIIIPKYNNYAAPELSNPHDTTKALIPLKTLRIKSPQELFPFFQARSRAKRDEVIIPDYNNIRQKPALVVYSIYRSMGPLLPNNYDNTVQNRLGMLAMANSPVVWLTMRAANSSEFMSKNIQPKITYMLKMVEPIGRTRPQCAIWDFVTPPAASSSSPSTTSQNKNSSSTYGIKQTGRFTTRGCEIKGIHPNHRLRYKYDYVNCSCDHLGAVTVLMDSTASYDYLSGEETNFKDMAIIISLGISIFILLVALFVLSCVRGHSIKSNSNSINKNLIFILIIIELMILYTVYSRSSLNQREYQCKLVAIFLHYFSISLFFWLMVNAIHFYRMLTELRDINHGPMKFYHVLGYAVPAFFVSIAVGLRIEQFGNYLFCWLSIHEPIIWSMFGPISLVSIVTIVLFMLALCRSLPVKEDPTGADLIKSHMFINIIKTPMIGIYWLITVYTVNEALMDYVYLFPVIAILKSSVLFVLLCIVDKYIRYNLYVSWLRFKGEKVPFMEESMNYSNSQQWMSPMMGGMPDALVGPYGKSQPTHLYTGNGQVMTPGFQSSCTDIFRPELLAGLSAASTTSRSTATGTSSSVAYREYRQHRVKESHRVDEDGGDYGRAGRSGRHRRRHKKSHRKHHHHRHHHHHHHHRSHPHHDDDHYEHHEAFYGRSRRSHNHGGGHYDRTSKAHQQQLSSNSIDNSQNDLASSHSSDDDVSTLPKKPVPQSHSYNFSNQAATTETVTQPGNMSHSMAEQQQTVPMELLAPSTSGAQQQHEDFQNSDPNETVAHTST